MGNEVPSTTTQISEITVAEPTLFDVQNDASMPQEGSHEDISHAEIAVIEAVHAEADTIRFPAIKPEDLVPQLHNEKRFGRNKLRIIVAAGTLAVVTAGAIAANYLLGSHGSEGTAVGVAPVAATASAHSANIAPNPAVITTNSITAKEPSVAITTAQAETTKQSAASSSPTPVEAVVTYKPMAMVGPTGDALLAEYANNLACVSNYVTNVAVQNACIEAITGENPESSSATMSATIKLRERVTVLDEWAKKVAPVVITDTLTYDSSNQPGDTMTISYRDHLSEAAAGTNLGNDRDGITTTAFVQASTGSYTISPEYVLNNDFLTPFRTSN